MTGSTTEHLARFAIRKPRGYRHRHANTARTFMILSLRPALTPGEETDQIARFAKSLATSTECGDQRR
jgi:hypothetical protein